MDAKAMGYLDSAVVWLNAWGVSRKWQLRVICAMLMLAVFASDAGAGRPIWAAGLVSLMVLFSVVLDESSAARGAKTYNAGRLLMRCSPVGRWCRYALPLFDAACVIWQPMIQWPPVACFVLILWWGMTCLPTDPPGKRLRETLGKRAVLAPG